MTNSACTALEELDVPCSSEDWTFCRVWAILVRCPRYC